MRRFALMALTFVFVTVVPAPAADPSPAEEKKKLEGTWTIEKLENEGLDAPAADVKDITVTITADTVVLKSPIDEKKLKYTADPAKKPNHEFDMTALDGVHKDKVCPGIYKFDGEKLIICAAKTPTTPRPADFMTKSNSGLTMMVLKRSK